MEDIRGMDWNGVNVVSTFAGGGGSSTGYRMTGAHVLYANEFVSAAAHTYQTNARPQTIVDTTDVRKVTGAAILEQIGLGVGELDIFDGSPPCSAFSTAGRRESGWGKAKEYSDDKVQVVDDLFFEYARLVREIQPKVFVAENVSGLVKGAAKGYFLRILQALRACGYQVEAKLLDASWLGVPQARQRLIFIGVRNDLGRQPVFPKPWPYRYAVRDVLPALERQGSNGGFGTAEFLPTDRPSPTLGASPNTGNGLCPPSAVVDRSLFRGDADPEEEGGIVRKYRDPAGGPPYLRHDSPRDPYPTVMAKGAAGVGHAEFAMTVTPPADDLPDGTLVHKAGGWDKPDRDLFTKRPPSQVFPTVMAVGAIGTVHGQFGIVARPPSSGAAAGPGPEWRAGVPYCPETGEELLVHRIRVGEHDYRPPAGKVLRKLTIPELRILCSFPADFVLTGTYEQRWERCGRAVPPLMMRAIADTVIREILCAG
jgi:DNA (cytosine-5)-methyltransferase 1